MSADEGKVFGISEMHPAMRVLLQRVYDDSPEAPPLSLWDIRALADEIERLRRVCRNWGENYQSWVDAHERDQATIADLRECLAQANEPDVEALMVDGSPVAVLQRAQPTRNGDHVYDALNRCILCGHAHDGPEATRFTTVCPGKPPEADAPTSLIPGLRSLMSNYETRAAYAPNPPAQWKDIAADLRRLLEGTS